MEFLSMHFVNKSCKRVFGTLEWKRVHEIIDIDRIERLISEGRRVLHKCLT